MKKAILITLAAIGGVFVLLTIIGLVIGGSKTTNATTAASHSTAATQPAVSPATTAPAPPATHPKGSYNGSCNYTLGSDPVGGTAMATGDIQIHNTGNVGTVDRLRITWPQQGYAPLSMSKTVKLGTGASRDIQFHRSLTQTELDNLQNWQTGHNFADGCTYKATITDTFGPVS